MRKSHKVERMIGLVLHVLIGGLMIFAGASKLFGLLPPDAVKKMAELGLSDKLQLIGGGELISGLLLIIPLTSSLGVLLTSGFWGGVICFHLTRGEPYLPYAVFLALTWALGSPEIAELAAPIRRRLKK